MKNKNGNGSDYGLYGKTGTFSAHELPVDKCDCGYGPIIEVEYDDTVGFKETVYKVKCNMCNKSGSETSDIDSAFLSWELVCRD